MGLQETFGRNPPRAVGGKLSVIPVESLTNGTFRNTFGMTPEALYDMVGKGLPHPEISVSLESSGNATLEITCRAQGKTIFKAEDCALQRNAGILSIARDRDTEVRATEKGQGLGKIFLSNMLTLAEELHLKRVDMRAGRENGAWYWSYRGAQLDTDVNSVVYERFERAVRQNMEKLPEALQQQAEAILATPGPDANVRLARLGREEGADLLNGTNPMVVFHVQDKTQMQNVRAALGNMDAAYERVRQRDIITPAAPKV